MIAHSQPSKTAYLIVLDQVDLNLNYDWSRICESGDKPLAPWSSRNRYRGKWGLLWLTQVGGFTRYTLHETNIAQHGWKTDSFRIGQTLYIQGDRAFSLLVSPEGIW